MKVKDFVKVFDGDAVVFNDYGKSVKIGTDKFISNLYDNKLIICSFSNYLEKTKEEIKEHKEDFKDMGVKFETWMNCMEEIADGDEKLMDAKAINELSENVMNEKITRVIPILWNDFIVTFIGIIK